ncbi:MAG: amino acid permease, partial [Myxococcales bacterium]|nr:amino acid permease [Myxococcales bacterium]
MHRALGALDLTAIGVGGIIGAGIFVLTGQAAAQYAGPAIVLSFLLAGLACGFAGLCYAELASMIPVAGSAYTYSYATLGEVVAWFIGWDLVLEYVVGAAAVAVGWSGYVVSFLRGFGVDLPPEIIAAPGTEFVFVDAAQIAAHKGLSLTAGWHALEPIAKSLAAAGVSVAALPHKSSVFNVPAVAIVALVTLVLTIGIRESARFNAVIVVLKVTVILLVIGVGFAYIRSEHWTPFLPPNTGKFGQFGVSGVLRGAGVIFFAYIGFDAVSTAAQETKNPQRDLPIGILASL